MGVFFWRCVCLFIEYSLAGGLGWFGGEEEEDGFDVDVDVVSYRL